MVFCIVFIALLVVLVVDSRLFFAPSGLFAFFREKKLKKQQKKGGAKPGSVDNLFQFFRPAVEENAL